MILSKKGRKKRPYLHLSDYADAIIRCMNPKAINCDIHIGSEDLATVDEIAQIAYQYAKPKKKLKIEWSSDIKLVDANIPWNPTKAYELIGWKQKIRLKEGIKRLVKDFKSSQDVQ